MHNGESGVVVAVGVDAEEAEPAEDADMENDNNNNGDTAESNGAPRLASTIAFLP